MTIVVDASVTMAWCFEDEATAATDAVLDQLRTDEAAVPAPWQLEVINVVLGAQRRGRLTEAQAMRFLGLLGQLPIRVDTLPVDVHEVHAVAARHGLTAYDAAYLVLAERLSAPLATLDEPLAAAARNAGVTLLIAG
jgi:predicted nucleic acid-binding protein